MAAWNPRYVAYARAHGNDPEKQLAVDTERYPGLKMVEFSFWLEDRWREWEKAANKKFRSACTDEDHRCFDAWLDRYVTENLERYRKGATL